MKEFTKVKFLSLTVYQQHKQLAFLLKKTYQNRQLDALDLYTKYLGFLEYSLPSIDTFEAIADRYHWHLKEGRISIRENSFLQTSPSLDSKEKKLPSFQVSIYLDKIRSAHNIGNIIRTTEAIGFEKVFFSQSMAFIDNKQVQDTSMETYQWVSCEKIDELEQLPGPIISLEIHPDGIPVDEYLFPKQFTLALGNEEYGCSKELLEISDAIVYIPLRGRKSSLNVANAYAITAYEIIQQIGSHSDVS
jgi:tRNA G18 (ribose-2'-O)-methylase SpoU